MRRIKYILGLATICAALFAFPISAQAAQTTRLDTHQGEITGYVQEYSDQYQTTAISHYLWYGDWYDVGSTYSGPTRYWQTSGYSVTVGSGDSAYSVWIDTSNWFYYGSVHSQSATYPLTISGRTSGSTALGWFNYDSFWNLADGKAGTFSVNYTQTKWYNAIPSSNAITYADDRAGTTHLFVYNNGTGFSTSSVDNGNSNLKCDASTIMTPTEDPTAVCINDPTDTVNADYGWQFLNHSWTTTKYTNNKNGLVQGTNTVYMAGADLWGNYATSTSKFLYDTIAPKTTIKNDEGLTEGLTPVKTDDANISITDPGASSGTGSGLADYWYRISTDGGNTFGSWIEGTSTINSKGTTTQKVSLAESKKHSNGDDDFIEVKTEDVAGNYSVQMSGEFVIKDYDIDAKITSGDNTTEYRTNTDVILGMLITNNGDDVNADDDTEVSCTITGMTIKSKKIVVPKGKSTYVWFKWHTPMFTSTLSSTIKFDIGYMSKSMSPSFNIEELVEKTPADPTALDKKTYYFSYDSVPSLATAANGTDSWNEYTAVDNKQTQYVFDDDSVLNEHDSYGNLTVYHSRAVPNGSSDWAYTSTNYTASLTSTLKATPDTNCPTATLNGSTYSMKSGYGINEALTSSVKLTSDITTLYSLSASDSLTYPVTKVQNVVGYYPEFEYNDSYRDNGGFDRILESTSTSSGTGLLGSIFNLKANGYSHYNSRVHFTPLWYNDGLYTPTTYVFDAWTPLGMLSSQSSDTIIISGDLFDDWHIGPADPNK